MMNVSVHQTNKRVSLGCILLIVRQECSFLHPVASARFVWHSIRSQIVVVTMFRGCDVRTRPSKIARLTKEVECPNFGECVFVLRNFNLNSFPVLFENKKLFVEVLILIQPCVMGNAAPNLKKQEADELITTTHCTIESEMRG